jgi:hypothetical protein
MRIELVDTVGLHEADSGTVPPEEAVKQLVELLHNSKEGFNLLLHVSRAGRLTKEHQEDYAFFVDKMTERRIPVVLVLTGCENEHPMSSWVDANRASFRQFQYRDLVATCFAAGGRFESVYKPLRRESRDAVLGAICTVALPAPVKLFGDQTGRSLSQFLAKIWNDFVQIAGLPDRYRALVNENAYDFLMRIGVSQKIAQAAITHLPDLLAELASKTPIPGAGPLVKFGAKKILEALLKKLGIGSRQSA